MGASHPSTRCYLNARGSARGQGASVGDQKIAPDAGAKAPSMADRVISAVALMLIVADAGISLHDFALMPKVFG
jgi:hypothetical protein